MPRSQRARSARAIANDEAILAAAVSEMLRVGVDHVSLRDVGHQAGLTHGATYARYEDVDELLVDLWNSLLSQRAIEMFEICMHAAEVPTEESVGAIFEYLRASTPTDFACVQVLLTARRIPTLHEEVEPFLHDYLEKGPSNSGATSATFTRGLTVFSMMLIQIFADSQFGTDQAYQDALQQLLLDTLQTDPRDIGHAALRAPDDRIILAPSDDLKQQLAYATFGVVGKSGYTRATISRIARRASCSPGAIYKLYLSKEDLVIAAFHDLMRARWMRISNFIDVLEEGSITQLLYNSASNENEVRQSFTLETALAAVHSDKLRGAILGQLGELEAVIPLLDNISDDEKNRLRYLIRSITYATIGVTFFSTFTNALQSTDLNQFAEPFRRAILKDCVPTWSEMCHQILELVNSRGY
ncbi:MAG TPA: TetR/AcrR family transcriptional regulator [Acidimicrobiales bacterium]|nr:TetR/AcrR family transcriptional regulator [Acidimicrobiales bacterium]